MYDATESGRVKNDEMYAIFFGPDEDLEKHTASLARMIADSYGNSMAPEALEAYRMLPEMDRIAKHAFVLMCLYAYPPFLLHFLGDGKDAKPPPMVNREGFVHYVETKIAPACEKMLNNSISIEDFVNILRAEYIFMFGVHQTNAPQ